MRFLKLVAGLIAMLCFWPMLGAVFDFVSGKSGMAMVMTAIGLMVSSSYLLVGYIERK